MDRPGRILEFGKSCHKAKFLTPLKQENSDLTVNQSGGTTARVSGNIGQEIIQKNAPSAVGNYQGLFLAVWPYQKGSWPWLSWQHANLEAINLYLMALDSSDYNARMLLFKT